jgi:hypothetical protein
MLFLVLLFNYSKAQTISGIIVDSITKQPLDLVNVTIKNKDIGVYTKPDGKFKLKLTNAEDEMLVSCLGYKTKTIGLLNFINKNEYEPIFYLSPTTEALNEVLVGNKKINYSWAKTIKSKRENTQYFGFQFGAENCTYIENPYRKRGKIKSVILDLKKQPEYNKENPKWKLDYLADYNIKFYRFDSIKNKPGEEIYNKDIIIDPQNKTGNLTIDVDSLHIPFPENGICVGVEMINTRYKNPKKVFATIGPIINFTENREMHPIMAWSRFRYEKEWEFKTASRSEDRKGRKYNMMIVDLVINTEK